MVIDASTKLCEIWKMASFYFENGRQLQSFSSMPYQGMLETNGWKTVCLYSAHCTDKLLPHGASVAAAKAPATLATILGMRLAL